MPSGLDMLVSWRKHCEIIKKKLSGSGVTRFLRLKLNGVIIEIRYF